MSTDGQGTLRRRNIAENFNRLSRVHERYRQTTDRRQTTDGPTMTYSERELEFTFAKNRELIWTISGSKRVKSGKDLPFGSFMKNIYPHSHQPQNSENCAIVSRLTHKTLINLGGSASKICIRIGQPMGISILDKLNLGRNFTPEVVLWPFLHTRTKSGQNGSKPGQNSSMYETGHGEITFVQY